MLEAVSVDFRMAIGAESSQHRSGDPLKYTADEGAVAFLIGRENPVAVINDYKSHDRYARFPEESKQSCI